MSFEEFWNKVRRRVLKMRLQPIRVFCFHQVSDEYEPLYGGVENWTKTVQFKKKIVELKKKYTFVSITDALRHMRCDVFRIKKYAVLTCDDGYQSILEVLPWLEEEKVPIALFLSVKYLDGVSYDPWFDDCWKSITIEEKEALLKRMYIHWDHLHASEVCAENVTIAIHGLAHEDVSHMENKDFEAYVDECVTLIGEHPRFEPFYAYTWGRHSSTNDRVLMGKGLIPVYCDGKNNYCFNGAVHRECIDGNKLEL